MQLLFLTQEHHEGGFGEGDQRHANHHGQYPYQDDDQAGRAAAREHSQAHVAGQEHRGGQRRAVANQDLVPAERLVQLVERDVGEPAPVGEGEGGEDKEEEDQEGVPPPAPRRKHLEDAGSEPAERRAARGPVLGGGVVGGCLQRLLQDDDGVQQVEALEDGGHAEGPVKARRSQEVSGRQGRHARQQADHHVDGPHAQGLLLPVLTQVGDVGEAAAKEGSGTPEQGADQRRADEEVEVELEERHGQEGQRVDQRADQGHDDGDLAPSTVAVGHQDEGDDEGGDHGEELGVEGEERGGLLHFLGTSDNNKQ